MTRQTENCDFFFWFPRISGYSGEREHVKVQPCWRVYLSERPAQMYKKIKQSEVFATFCFVLCLYSANPMSKCYNLKAWNLTGALIASVPFSSNPESDLATYLFIFKRTLGKICLEIYISLKWGKILLLFKCMIWCWVRTFTNTDINDDVDPDLLWSSRVTDHVLVCQSCHCYCIQFLEGEKILPGWAAHSQQSLTIMNCVIFTEC